MSETPDDPWPAGARVRLARPDLKFIPDRKPHPYTGCTGVVLKALWIDPVFKLRKGVITDAAPEMIEPGVWLLTVKLEPGPGVEERWKRQTEWLLFDRELERVG
jgi:hypothetical protein